MAGETETGGETNAEIAAAGDEGRRREERVVSCLNVLRRVPPNEVEENLADLAALLSDEEAAEELYQRSDPPLGHAFDSNASANDDEAGKGKGKPFIVCDYNRDGDRYRSPWSNAYYPPPAPPLPSSSPGGGEGGPDDDDGFYPPPWLRHVEVVANELFDAYRSAYYGDDGSVSSAYLWDTSARTTDDDSGGNDGSGSAGTGRGFAGAFLIEKQVRRDDGDGARSSSSSDRRCLGPAGVWNSIHVVEVTPSREGRTATYGMTTTISWSMDPTPTTTAAGAGAGAAAAAAAAATGGTDGQSPREKGGGAATNLAGSLSRRTERVRPISSSADLGEEGSQHVANIGRMIEDVESEMRSAMDSMHIQRTRYVVDSIRSDAAGAGGGGGAPTNGKGCAGGLSNQRMVATMLTEAVLARQANE